MYRNLQQGTFPISRNFCTLAAVPSVLSTSSAKPPPQSTAAGSSAVGSVGTDVRDIALEYRNYSSRNP